MILSTAVVAVSVTAAVHEQTPIADEEMNAMTSKSFAQAGATNLSKHVGQKVFVTGSLPDGSMGTMHQDVSTLTVETLKVIGKSTGRSSPAFSRQAR